MLKTYKVFLGMCESPAHIGPNLMASAVKACTFPSDRGRTKW